MSMRGNIAVLLFLAAAVVFVVTAKENEGMSWWVMQELHRS